MSRNLVIIAGPTAVGKTGLAIELALHFSTEIVSADSRQVYSEMRIGTAVPTTAQLSIVPHHLVAHRSIHDYYNASIFETEAMNKLEQLFARNDIIFMAGGSGLYIQAVCQGIDDLPAVDPLVRQSLLTKYRDEGIESLRMQLKMTDPDYYRTVDLKNHRRILKALEVTMMTGKPYSVFLTGEKKRRPFNIIRIGLDMDRDHLYQRINQRTEEMFQYGLEEEARCLYPFRHLNALHTVGYKELFDTFDGKISLEEARERIKKNTRNYARKQLTWFRKDKNMRWFHPSHTSTIIECIKKTVRG